MTGLNAPKDQNSTLLNINGAQDFARAFDVSRETTERLEIYAACLRDWQKAINLVSQTTIDSLWQRHFADSAQIVEHATDSRIWADLGSGAGFPGMIIAIMCHQQFYKPIQLIESNGKKCAFLRHVARETGLTVEIIEARIETLSEKPTLQPVDCITARALAPLGKLLTYASPLFETDISGTKALFLKGQDTAREIKEAQKHWSFEFKLHPSRTDPEGQIVEITKLRAV